MTSIFISIGQCGSQLSGTLINYLNANSTASNYLYKYYDEKYRFISIDKEKKAVLNLLGEFGNELRKENCVYGNRGAGSLWPVGYLDSTGTIRKSLDLIRREAERADFLLNFNLLHSLSGGTGTGCTSKLIEELRDEYGYKKSLHSLAVAPFSLGETPLQDYNSMFCMSYLNELADLVYLFQNDDVLYHIEKLLIDQNMENKIANNRNRIMPRNLKINSMNAAANELVDVSFDQMNAHIVKCLLSVLMPIGKQSNNQYQSIGMEQLELQRMLCSLPSLKIVELYNVNSNYSSQLPKSTEILPASLSVITLLKSLLGSVPKFNINEIVPRNYASLSSLLISRSNVSGGKVNNDPNAQIGQLMQEYATIKQSLNPVSWNSEYSIDFWASKYVVHSAEANKSTSASSNSSLSSSSSLTLATNRDRCLDYLRLVEQNSRAKYQSKAYLNWFSKYGVDDSIFERSFESFRSLIDAYSSIK